MLHEQATNIALELVEAGDAAALATLRVEAMRESLERIGRFDPDRARTRFLANFAPEFTRAIVRGGERIGFVVVRPDGDGWLLDHLYVRPGFQGQGVGAQVLRRVFAEADAGGTALRVGALRGSDANRFYVSHGFELVERAEFDNYYVRLPMKTVQPWR